MFAERQQVHDLGAEPDQRRDLRFRHDLHLAVPAIHGVDEFQQRIQPRNRHGANFAVTGSLGPNSVVQGMWIQREKCGLWLTGNNTNLLVQNNRIIGTTADGINLDGSASGVQVKNNFLRNTGDDGLAIWSYPVGDSSITFANNTIVQPSLANGIADYGGSNNTIALQPLSGQGQIGFGVAGGISAMDITPAEPVRRRHRHRR